MLPVGRMKLQSGYKMQTPALERLVHRSEVSHEYYDW